jgi:hypothetical protein
MDVVNRRRGNIVRAGREIWRVHFLTGKVQVRQYRQAAPSPSSGYPGFERTLFQQSLAADIAVFATMTIGACVVASADSQATGQGFLDISLMPLPV